jgi:hypothetical protein
MFYLFTDSVVNHLGSKNISNIWLCIGLYGSFFLVENHIALQLF